MYNVERLSCKFWSVWTEIKTAASTELALLLQVTRDLQLDFVLLRILPIKLVSEKRLTVRLCFFLSQRLPIGLASERRITVGLVLFSFYYFDDQLDLPVKETDRLYCCVRNLRLWQEGSEP